MDVVTEAMVDRERRIYQAAGISPADVSAETASVVRWLAGWDEHTMRGVAALLAVSRADAAGRAQRPSA